MAQPNLRTQLDGYARGYLQQFLRNAAPCYVYLSQENRADKRTRTANLISSRVIHQALQGVARACEFRICMGIFLLRFALPVVSE